MRKIEREYRSLFESEGFEVQSVRHRNGHYAFSTQRGVVFCAGTPSDSRNLTLVRAKLRRLQR